jgi:hypothetical protein
MQSRILDSQGFEATAVDDLGRLRRMGVEIRRHDEDQGYPS